MLQRNNFVSLYHNEQFHCKNSNEFNSPEIPFIQLHEYYVHNIFKRNKYVNFDMIECNKQCSLLQINEAVVFVTEKEVYN